MDETPHVTAWLERFKEVGTPCPACGCRDARAFGATAIELSDDGKDLRLLLHVVCDNPNCGFVRLFAPKLDPISPHILRGTETK